MLPPGIEPGYGLIIPRGVTSRDTLLFESNVNRSNVGSITNEQKVS